MTRLACAIVPVSSAWAQGSGVDEHWSVADSTQREGGVAIDASGNVLRAAEAPFGGTTGQDLALSKRTPTGELLWETTFDGPASSTDEFHDLALDAGGNLFVVGVTPVGGQANLFVLAVDVDGNVLWERFVFGKAFDDRAAVALGPTGEVAVSGQRDGEALVALFAADGTLLWERVEDLGAATLFAEATDVEIDASGDVLVAGYRNTASALEFILLRYSPTGDLRWSRTEGGDFGTVFPPAWVGLDGVGGAFLVGSSETTCGLFEFRAIRYAADGASTWEAAYPGDPCSSIELKDLAVDPNGDPVLVGFGYLQPDFDFDYQVAKLDGATGAIEWTDRVKGDLSKTDTARAVTTDAAGRIYVCGSVDETGTMRHPFTIAYDPDGAVAWQALGSGNEWSVDIAAGPFGGVALANRGSTARYHQPTGTRTCVSTTNSTGNAASLTAFGSEVLAVGDLTLVAEAVPDRPGLFFHGPNATQVPLGNGFLCIGGKLVRFPPLSATGGRAEQVVDLKAGAFTPGTRHFQYWFRDPAAGGAKSNTSDAASLLFR